MIDLADVKAWLAVSSVREALTFVLTKLRAGLGRIRVSFVALVSSPAVWLAVTVMFVGGFWLGHLEGAGGKRALRAEVVKLETNAAIQTARISALQGGNQAAIADIRKLKDEIATLKAEQTRAPEAKSEGVAAISRRPLAKPRPVPAAVAAPPERDWRPF